MSLVAHDVTIASKTRRSMPQFDPERGVEKRLRHTHRKISFLWKSVENLGGKRWEKRPVDR
jgi:hypothetical protein